MLNNKAEIIAVVDAAIDMFARLYQCQHPQKNIRGIKDNGEWGYVINRNFSDVVAYLLENKLTKIVDLGAGVGHGMELLHKMGLYARGYENEDELIEENAKLLGLNVSLLITKKDVMTLTTTDIEKFEVIYFWDPFKDEELKQKFMNNLVEIMLPNQIILYKHQPNRRKFNNDKNPLQKIVETRLDIEEHEEYGTLTVFRKIS